MIENTKVVRNFLTFLIWIRSVSLCNLQASSDWFENVDINVSKNVNNKKLIHTNT